MNGAAAQVRDFHGRYAGVRANVEDVPRLPAAAARAVLEDPRAVVYLAVWTSYHYGEVPPVAVDLVAELRRRGPNIVDVQGLRFGFAVHVTRHARFRGRDELAWLCPDCGKGTRFLYLHRVSPWGIVPTVHGCARCRRLLWSSQGRPIGPLARALRGGAARAPLPRLAWDPVAVGTPAALERRYPGLLALVAAGATGRAVRRPTMRDLEVIRRQVAAMPARLARLEARPHRREHRRFA